MHFYVRNKISMRSVLECVGNLFKLARPTCMWGERLLGCMKDDNVRKMRHTTKIPHFSSSYSLTVLPTSFQGTSDHGYANFKDCLRQASMLGAMQ